MRCIVTTIAIALAVTCANAADDPAIRACETIIQTELSATEGYERIEATVHPYSVKITYKRQISGNSTASDSYTCHFKFSEGQFVLWSPVLDASRKRMEEIRKHQAEMESSPKFDRNLRGQLALEALANLNEVMPVTLELIERTRTLEKAGIFPILPDKTNLRAE